MFTAVCLATLLFDSAFCGGFAFNTAPLLPFAVLQVRKISLYTVTELLSCQHFWLTVLPLLITRTSKYYTRLPADVSCLPKSFWAATPSRKISY